MTGMEFDVFSFLVKQMEVDGNRVKLAIWVGRKRFISMELVEWCSFNI